jgi:hypothetical protein
MKKVVQAIRELWKVRCVIHLDDLLILHQDQNHLVRSKMELSKINKVVRFALNSTIALGYYSFTASNEEAIATLMEKDVLQPQREKVEKLISFEKEKFEENMELSDDDLDYQKEYKEMFDDEEIEELVKTQEIEQKEKSLKLLKTSQSSNSVKDPMKSSMKDLVKGFLQLINDQKQGNTEVNVK